MEASAMGRVVTEMTVENLEDLWAVKQGRLSDDQVRRLTVSDALVDTGATMLSLPTRLIQQLGLAQRMKRRVCNSAGIDFADVYEAVRLTIQGRDCTLDVIEVPDEVPPLVGQVALELLDFVVDPRNQRLIGNPAHGGVHTLEL